MGFPLSSFSLETTPLMMESPKVQIKFFIALSFLIFMAQNYHAKTRHQQQSYGCSEIVTKNGVLGTKIGILGTKTKFLGRMKAFVTAFCDKKNGYFPNKSLMTTEAQKMPKAAGR